MEEETPNCIRPNSKTMSKYSGYEVLWIALLQLCFAIVLEFFVWLGTRSYSYHRHGYNFVPNFQPLQSASRNPL